MDKKRVGQIKEQFDLVIHSEENTNVEFWFARELMTLLGYERWENFDKTINARWNPVKPVVLRYLTIFVRTRKWFPWVAAHIEMSRTIC